MSKVEFARDKLRKHWSQLHANPAPDYETLAPRRSQTFMRLAHAECGKIIDCSVAVLTKSRPQLGERSRFFGCKIVKRTVSSRNPYIRKA